jgi:hypothetical protein
MTPRVQSRDRIDEDADPTEMVRDPSRAVQCPNRFGRLTSRDRFPVLVD